jgi:hypothetical protein
MPTEATVDSHEGIVMVKVGEEEYVIRVANLVTYWNIIIRAASINIVLFHHSLWKGSGRVCSDLAVTHLCRSRRRAIR